MSEFYRFDSLKNELIEEVYKIDETLPVPEEFRKRFFNLVQLLIFSLMKSENNFYALFVIQMKREIKLNIDTAIATKPQGGHFTMYLNPKVLLFCTLNEMQALLKHEVYHILSLHHARAKKLREKFSSLAVNLAMDISVNQFITHLPAWSETLERVRLSYNVDLYDAQTIEQYAEDIQKAINKLTKDKKNGRNISNNLEQVLEMESDKSVDHDMEKAHDIWYEGQEDYDNEQIKEITRKMLDAVSKNLVPESIQNLINSLNSRPEISWSEVLRRTLGTIPVGKKKTSTRRDRRQPERLDLRGSLTEHIAELIVAIDISGSVSDKEIEKIMSEVFSIVRNYPHKITIVECDNDIRRTYEVKSMKDVKQKLNTRGGTKYSPVFRYIRENAKRNSTLIYFTDGLGEAELECIPVNFKTIWVLTGKEQKLSLRKPYGTVKRLSAKANVSNTTNNILAIEYLKDEMRDQRTEWAK